MKPYLVVGDSETKLGLEDLSMENRDRHAQIVVVREDAFTLLNDKGESAKILKILPADFKLSPFNDGNGRLIYDKDRILYDLSPALVDFTDDMGVEIGSIIGVSDWMKH